MEEKNNITLQQTLQHPQDKKGWNKEHKLLAHDTGCKKVRKPIQTVVDLPLSDLLLLMSHCCVIVLYSQIKPNRRMPMGDPSTSLSLSNYCVPNSWSINRNQGSEDKLQKKAHDCRGVNSLTLLATSKHTNSCRGRSKMQLCLPTAYSNRRPGHSWWIQLG